MPMSEPEKLSSPVHALENDATVILPLAKTCLYTAYFVMKRSRHVRMEVLRLLGYWDGTTSADTDHTHAVDIDSDTTSRCMDMAKSVLNSLGAQASALRKTAGMKGIADRMDLLIRSVTDRQGIRADLLGTFIHAFRTQFPSQEKRSKQKHPVCFATKGKQSVTVMSWEMLAKGTDKFGKPFRLYALYDGEHCFVLNSSEAVDDLLENTERVTVNVERTEDRKGVKQSLCSIVSWT